ncbi:hypothetical protein KI387_028838, partial [Taxus chinensis]
SNPNGVLDLVQLLVDGRVSGDAEAFAEHMQQLQEEVQKKLQNSNDKYKEITDVHRWRK